MPTPIYRCCRDPRFLTRTIASAAEGEYTALREHGRRMTYRLTFELRPAYLYCLVTGENSSTNVVAYLSDILCECRARGCFRVLIDERLEGPRLRISDVFQIASEEGKRALGILRAIAYVDANASGD